MRHPFFEDNAVIAHRGGSWPDVPENSIPAFVNALAVGATHLETDLQLSVDGVLIACHDARIGDTRTVHVESVTAAEIGRFHTDSIRHYPMFNDVLDAVGPDARLVIDPKSEGALRALIKLLRDRPGLLDRVCIGAFSDRRLAIIRAEFGPALATSLGPLEVARLIAGFPPKSGFKGVNAAQIPLRIAGIPIATERVVSRAKEAGLDVHLWTLNTEVEMREALRLGADGIVTDEISMALRVLEA